MGVLAATGRIDPYEEEYFRMDGSHACVPCAGRDLKDGTVVGFAIDISGRKRAKEQPWSPFGLPSGKGRQQA